MSIAPAPTPQDGAPGRAPLPRRPVRRCRGALAVYRYPLTIFALSRLLSSS